ncbi:MAG: rhodanese-like domain-containing protein [candidate division WOR-3 bacterium]|nr:rhodanese-like domain-containing protein [candidate division WOR-3 bacterium]MCX7947449.1 rhodanese-like domain-containing protein [candidate division WOR-3 bacterium]MDW8150609.1 rhodanese-like domain-containing protein [candidate division WOR-3 bacterium]
MLWLINFQSIDVEWLNKYINNSKGKAIIIDVRTEQEHKAGYIPKTKYNIPHDQIADRIGKLKIDSEKDTIIVYCRSGNRSKIAATILENKGYKNVLNLDGGIKAWTLKGYKLETK